jgi:hypothetical protein
VSVEGGGAFALAFAASAFAIAAAIGRAQRIYMHQAGYNLGPGLALVTLLFLGEGLLWGAKGDP